MRTSSMRIDQQAMTCECGSPAWMSDAARLIAFALELASDFAGGYGDDNLGGWQGRPPFWTYRLFCPDTTFRTAI